MKVCSSLICLFFLTALQDANAEISVLTGEEGGNITHGCQFSPVPPVLEKTKIFCRGECKEGEVLIRTTADTAQNGRYSIENKNDMFSQLLYVSITNLTKSDSGRYRCGSHTRFWNSVKDFEIRVKAAPVASTPNWTPGALSSSVPSASSLTTAQSLCSSSGSSTPPSASPEASEQQQTSAEGPGVLLYVGLTLLVMVGALLAAVLIAKSVGKPKEPPVEAECTNATEPGRVYEEIQEEKRGSGPPPGEISTLYSQATFPKPNTAEATDVYSLVTAATSQTTPEDESSKVTYSQLDFAAPSLTGAPCGDAESVVYSAPRLQDASPPLYSTVTSQPL